MAYLPDNKIVDLLTNKKLIIEPYFDFFQGPNCYYCHIGNNFLIPQSSNDILDPLSGEVNKKYYKHITCETEYIFQPKSFLLAESFESFGVNNEYTIRLFNSSSLARCGIGHLALGMINPGCGITDPIKITLELVNYSSFPIKLTPTKIIGDEVIFGTEIFKVSIAKLESPVTKSYNKWSHAIFKDDKSVMASKMHLRYSNNRLKIRDKFKYE